MKANPSVLLRSFFTSARFVPAVGAAVALSLAPEAKAATATWNSGSGTTWNTGANWTGASGGTGTVPTSSDDVVFDNSNVTIPTPISLNAAESANSLTFGSGNGAALGAFTLQANTATTAETLTLTTGSITVASQVVGTITLGNNTHGTLTLNTGASSFSVNNNNTTQTLAIGAVFAGTSKNLLLNSSGGTIILSGANTATGSVTIGNGSNNTLVQLANAAALSSFVGTGGTTVNAGSAVDLAGTALSSTIFTLNGSGFGSGANAGALVNSTGTASDSGSITLATNATIKNTGTLLTLSGGMALGSHVLTVDGTGSTTLGTGVLSGTGGSIVKVNTGTLSLSGNNTFTGGVTINAGAVQALSNSNAFGTGTITLGNTSGASAASLLVGSSGLTIANPVVLATNASVGTLTIGNTGTGVSATFTGGITGSNNVTFNENGTTGSLTFSTGTLNNTGTITNTGAGTGVTTINSVIGSNVTGVVENSSTSALSLTGTNTFGGGLNISLGTVNINNSNAPGAATNTITLGSAGNNAATLNLQQASSGGITIVNPIVLAASDTGSLSITMANASPTVSGNVNLNGDNLLIAASGGSARTTTFSGTFSGSGNLTLQDNTISYGTSSTSGPNGITINNAVNITGAIANTGTGNGSTTISGALASTVTSVTENAVPVAPANGVNSPSTLTLSGANSSFTGSVTLTAGQLVIGSATALGSGGRLTIAGGTYLTTPNATNETVSTVNPETWNGSFTVLTNATLNMGSGAVTLGSPLTLTTTAGTFTIGGSIGGTTNGVFDITKSGFGTFNASANIALGANQTATVNQGVETLSGILSGSGFGMGSTGSGTLTLTGANTFTGAVNILGGSTLSVNSLATEGAGGGTASTLGASGNAAANLVINNGTLLSTSNSTSTDRLFTVGLGGATITASGATTFSNTGALAFAGSGTHTLTLGGSGTTASVFDPQITDGSSPTTLVKNLSNGRWSLSNTTSNNTYSGGTYIYGGALAATGTSGNNQELGTGTITVYGGGELQMASAGNLASGQVIVLAGNSNAYATADFGYNVTDAQLQADISSSSTSGVISLFADNGQSVSNALNMANYGDGHLFLGIGGLATGNSSQSTTYSASSLGVGSDNVYRLGGGVGTNTLVISNNVLAATTNSVTNSLIVGAPDSNNVIKFTANQSLTGATTINNGSVVLSGAAGALSTSTITVNNTQGFSTPVSLNLDDGTATSGTVTRAAGVKLDGGAIMTVTGNAGSNSNDVISGGLAIGPDSTGQNIVTIAANAGKNAELTAGSFSRSAGSVVVFRGANLGVNSLSSTTAGATNISFGAMPSLSGGTGGAGTPSAGIIVGAFGDLTTSDTGGTIVATAGGALLTYDATNGVRLLNSSEYLLNPTASTLQGLSGTGTGLQNVLYTTSSAAISNSLTGNATINSLQMTETGAQGSQAITLTGSAGTTLTVASGVIFASQSMTSATTSAGAQTISVPFLNFGSAEGVVYDGQANGGSNGFFSGGLNITSTIEGSGGLTIAGGGPVELSGSNSYTGVTTVDNGGRLTLNNVNALPGDLVLDSGAIQLAASLTASNTNFTINGGSFTDENGNAGSNSSATWASLTMNGGNYFTGTGGHGSNNIIAGTLTLNATTLLSVPAISIVNQTNFQVGGLATFNGGTVSVSTSDTGAGNNTYDTYIKFSGGLTIDNTPSGSYTPIAINASSNPWTNSGEVILDGSTSPGQNFAFTFNGSATNANTVTIGGPANGSDPGPAIQLNDFVTFNINDGPAPVDLTLTAGLIDGPAGGTLIKTGAGTMLLNGTASSYSGGTFLEAGTLALSGSATLGSNANDNGVTVDGGTLDLGGTTQKIENLVVNDSSTIQNGSLQAVDVFSGPSSYAISNPTGTATISANLLDSPATNSLSMSGTGALVLSGSNTYSGGTSLTAGTTYVNNANGSGTGSGAVTVSPGATLSGTGAIRPVVASGYAVTVATDANLAPGGVQPTPNFGPSPVNPANGSLILDPTGVASGQLLSVAPSSSLTNPVLTFALGSGGTSSQIDVAGTAANIINFNAGGTGSTSSVVSITDLVGVSLALNTEYVLIAGNGATTFENNGSALTLGPVVPGLGQQILGGLTLLPANTPGNFFSQWYNGASLYLNGDDIDVYVVPEPSTWALIVGGLATLLGWQRRKNRTDRD